MQSKLYRKLFLKWSLLCKKSILFEAELSNFFMAGEAGRGKNVNQRKKGGKPKCTSVRNSKLWNVNVVNDRKKSIDKTFYSVIFQLHCWICLCLFRLDETTRCFCVTFCSSFEDIQSYKVSVITLKWTLLFFISKSNLWNWFLISLCHRSLRFLNGNLQ